MRTRKAYLLVAVFPIALSGIAMAEVPIGFSQLDRNGDGMISASEARDDPRLARDFARLDLDGSGGIERGEYARSWTAAARTHDRNQFANP